MDVTSYNELLQMVEPLIGKQIISMRQPISPTDRLSITLRYLATGNTFEDLNVVNAIAPLTLLLSSAVCSRCYTCLSCECTSRFCWDFLVLEEGEGIEIPQRWFIYLVRPCARFF